MYRVYKHRVADICQPAGYGRAAAAVRRPDKRKHDVTWLSSANRNHCNSQWSIKSPLS